jgi:PAS domain S-box-containing protein
MTAVPGRNPLPSPEFSDNRSGRTLYPELPDSIELLNLASDAIIVCSVDRRINFWNSGAVAMYGWSVEEALGSNIHDLLKTTFPESREAARLALMNHGLWEGELIHVSRSGQPIVVTSKHVLQRDDHGVPVRILEINRDITSRKRMEQELKHNQVELEKIVEHRTAALRGLSTRLMRTQDEERRRIARELHDSLGQYLTDARIKLDLRVPMCSQRKPSSSRWHGSRSTDLSAKHEPFPTSCTLLFSMKPDWHPRSDGMSKASPSAVGSKRNSNYPPTLAVCLRRSRPRCSESCRRA